ncbi:MAG: substrate-binding protein [Magnetococcales bacterium]|nr:substrate-binding protein [Magnetococcales bacterium]
MLVHLLRLPLARLLVGLFFTLLSLQGVLAAESVKIGINYPKTGPYEVEGLDQWRATELALEEINAGGGILGKKVELLWRDSQSKPDVSTQNAKDLIAEGAKMLFGGSSSAVAIAVAKVAHENNIPFFGTLTYSTETTGKDGFKTTFRECYDAWMGAKVVANYLKEKFPNKKYLYITADYTWGHTTEASLRTLTGTTDTEVHKGVKTPFPTATEKDFEEKLKFAKMLKPDVLVLVLFGKDMTTAIRLATTMGLKQNSQIVVPNLTLGMAEGGGPKVMEGVIGALPWDWKIPEKYGFAEGKAFVEKFTAKYNRYPSTSGASAYVILKEYKAAVERAATFDTPAVIKALENHEYIGLKDKQKWRDFDHQSVQTVYAVRGNPESVVMKDKFKLDYFEILNSMPGEEAAITREEWNKARTAAGKPTELD